MERAAKKRPMTSQVKSLQAICRVGTSGYFSAVGGTRFFSRR